jgi:uncharacterized membrane protein YkoI
MKTLPSAPLKTALSAGLLTALLATTIGCTAMASSYDNQPVYRSGNNVNNNHNNNDFGRISQQLRQDLRRSGYQVMDIQLDNQRGNQALIVYAKKNNKPYVLKYTYPGLKRISSSQKNWSNIWQDKNNQQNGDGYYGNNYADSSKRYNSSDDVEDKIKKEARYPAIKQRAINKVKNMGYSVKDIELEEKNNRGVFEIEAKRGSQEYDIVLGYPNLNVIKIEKD